MKKIIAFISAVLIFGGIACADVIRLADGKIYLGKVVGGEAGIVVVEQGGDKKVVQKSDIIKTEKDSSALKKQTVDIHLKDGSILSGTIKDFDADVGVLLDIDFGSLTLPFESINFISDPVRKNYFNGSAAKIDLTGGYYFALGGAPGTFSDNFNVTLSAEINPNLVRGVFTGVSVSYINLYYIPNTALSYTVVNAQLYLSYRFLQLRSTDSFLNRFVPYLSAGAGAAYVNTYDSRSGFSSSAQNEVDFSFSGTIGIDFFIVDNFIVKVNGTWVSLVQATSLFNTLAVNIGVAFCF
jgi:hypothetical protein